jgi:hypothetical protein
MALILERGSASRSVPAFALKKSVIVRLSEASKTVCGVLMDAVINAIKKKSVSGSAVQSSVTPLSSS